MIIRYILLTLMAALFAGCSENEADTDRQSGECAGLMFTVSAPNAEQNIPMPDNEAERLRDGWVIKEIALFFCDESGTDPTVEAYRNISGITPVTNLLFNLSEENPNAETWVKSGGNSITGGNRYSKNVNPPKKGIYTVYAVANYSDISQSAGTNSISAIINNINGKPTPKNLNTQFAKLKNLSMTCGTSGLMASSNAMMLSMAGTVNIIPGSNNLKGHLKRSCARLQMIIRNESQTDIKINKLDLGLLTQASSKVFVTDGYKPGAATGRIDITSTNAIKKYTTDMVLPAMKPGAEIDEYMVFDGYLLDSSAPAGGYNFEFDLRAGSGNKTINTYTRAESVSQIHADETFMIQVRNTDKYLYVGADERNIMVGDNPRLYYDQDERYIWYADLTGVYSDYMYYKHNKSEWYIDGKKGGLAATIVNDVRKMYTDNNNIYWKENGYNYMTERNGTVIWEGPTQYLPRNTFTFVKVNQIEKTFQGTPHNTLMPFTKMVNNAPHKVTEINRNDFYQIFVNIRYNSKLELLEFSVENWNDKNLDIDFN